MPNTITIPFYSVKLHFSTGGNISMPLKDMDAFRIDQPVHLIAGKYANLFQEKVLNKGDLLKVMDEFGDREFQKSQFKITFPASKDGFSYPAFELEFEYFFSVTEHGAWGMVPVLGIESFTEQEQDLQANMVEAAKLEFERKKRLNAIQNIISTIWFETAELEKEEMLLKIPTPTELDNLEKESKDEVLPKIGNRLSGLRQATFRREKELDNLKRAAKSNFNKNILLIGTSGVGKTALVWELARQRKKFGIKEEIWETTASVLIKELSRDTGWQDNIMYLVSELRQKGDFLFIRNLAELFEVGKYEGNEISLAEYLRSFIQRGEVKIIAESTKTEVAAIELKSPGYIALFQQIRIEQPPAPELKEIIVNSTKSIAKNRNVSLEKDAIEEVIRLNRRFTPYSGFPGKPIRFLESLLVNLSQEKKATHLSKKEIIQHFCEDTGMPTFLVDPEIPMNLNQIKKQFNENVFGQHNAVKEVVDILATVKTALSRGGKPIASFLFVGPTGVGKTELAKVLAEFTFGSRDKMIRFDMSEYSNPWSVGRLIGNNYSKDGLLTSAVRREPFCVLLFDEIEKASANIYDLLLQILGEGRLTDSQGKLVNFCSTIIIMTSNIGATSFQGGKIGWKREIEVAEVVDHFKSAVEKHFRPELFNRIDQIIPFEPLSKENVRHVVEREIKILKEREGIKFRNLVLNIDKTVLDYLAEAGYDAKYGARQLQRTIREKLLIPLSIELNTYDFSDRLIIKLIADQQGINFQIEADPLGFDLLLEQWDQLSYADQASDFRRGIDKLKQGPTMVRFYNEFDYLENQKKKLGERFWKNQKRAEKYSNFLQIIESTRKLYEAIEKLEMDISLACLDIGQYNPDLEGLLQEWNESFFLLKKQIYTHLHPKSNVCHLAIYGNDFEELLQFYLSIIIEKEFQYTGKTIWFNEVYYHELVTDVDILHDEQNIVNKPRKEYKMEDWDGDLQNGFKPPQQGDILCGIELKILGECPFLYFKNEKGFHKWMLRTKEEKVWYLKISNSKSEIPENIHRQSFYKLRKHRRSFLNGSFNDQVLKITREIPRTGLKEFLMDILDKQFEEAIELEVI